jgi:hypothetical protein
MVDLGVKGLGIPCQADQSSPQPKLFIGISECLKEPDPEETRGTGDEDAGTTKLLPKRTRVRKHMLKVFLGERGKRHGIRSCLP